MHKLEFLQQDRWNLFRNLLRHPLMRYVQSILLVLLTSLLSIPIHWVIEPVNLVMLYLAAVVVAALFLGRGPAILASLLSVLTFDYFLVEPRLSFTVADSQYLLTFMGLLMVGLVISNSAALLRDQVQALRSREAHLDALNSLSRELTRAINLDEMLQSVITHVGKVLSHPVVILLPDKDGLQPVAASPALVLGINELAAAMRAYRQHRPSGKGTETLPDSSLYCLPLDTALGTVGVIGIGSANGAPGITAEQQQLLEGFASLTALAIQRARLADQASQAKILENTERLQTALLNSISHELRTPLVSITGALSSLIDAPVPLTANQANTTAWREMVDTAYQEAQRLNLLVGNLLDMTRLEAGAFRLNREPGDIQDLVGIVLARFAQRGDTHPIQVSLSEALPLVSIDVALMAQVLMNLLDNAAKYSPEHAPIDIKGWLEGQEIMLAVMDQGIGIPEADLPKVFDKFYRTYRSHGIRGIGLGLSISKGIVEAHEGRMWAENRSSGGTVIAMALPVEISTPAEGVEYGKRDPHLDC